MREFSAVLFITLVIVFGGRPHEASSQVTKPQAIPWQTSLDSALKLAQQQGKPVLLDFYNPK